MPKHKVRVAWLRWGIMRPSLVYILFYSGIRASDKCKQVNSQDIVIRTRNSLEAGPFSIVPSHKLKICHKLHTCLFCFKNSCHMSLECFLINQIQTIIPMNPMFLCSCAEKKTTKKNVQNPALLSRSTVTESVDGVISTRKMC